MIIISYIIQLYNKNQNICLRQENIMELKCNKNCHSQYRLEYHLILVTKYRRSCITPEMLEYLTQECRRLLALSEAELLEMNGEADHIHLLISAPPQICLAKMINSLKSTTSRLVRKKYADHLARFYWKPYFWNRSYLILSSGGAPIEVIRRYIQEQGK